MHSQIYAEVYENYWRYEPHRQYRVIASPLSTNFASKTSIASSKDNVVATAMAVPLSMEQLEYDPSINQLLLETLHGSSVFCFSYNYCKLVVNGIKLCECK